MPEFDRFTAEPAHIQPVETSPGEWNNRFKKPDGVTPDKFTTNQVDEMNTMGNIMAGAGWVVGGVSLLAGGGVVPAVCNIAYGHLLRAGVRAGSTVGMNQQADPDTHLKGVDSISKWMRTSLKDAMKEMPGEIRKEIGFVKEDIAGAPKAAVKKAFDGGGMKR